MNVLCKINLHKFKEEEDAIADGINELFEQHKIKERVKVKSCVRTGCRRVNIDLYDERKKKMPQFLNLERE